MIGWRRTSAADRPASGIGANSWANNRRDNERSVSRLGSGRSGRPPVRVGLEAEGLQASQKVFFVQVGGRRADIDAGRETKVLHDLMD